MSGTKKWDLILLAVMLPANGRADEYGTIVHSRHVHPRA